MEKEDKLYNYCFTCGYLGTKDNPKNCNHNKFKQLEDFMTQDELVAKEKLLKESDLVELQFEGLQDYIYENTWMKSKIVTKQCFNSKISIIFELTKTQARKPRANTIKVIKELSCVGFDLIFTDPNNYSINKNFIPALYEISNRSKALFVNSDEAELFKLWCSNEKDKIGNYLPYDTKILSKDDFEKYDMILIDKSLTNLYCINRVITDSSPKALKSERLIKLI